jgi:hypothetical protein
MILMLLAEDEKALAKTSGHCTAPPSLSSSISLSNNGLLSADVQLVRSASYFYRLCVSKEMLPPSFDGRHD